MTSSGLETYIHTSSVKGLSSVTTLIVGAKAAVIIDPPFLVPDAKSVVRWVKEKTSKPLKALFVTHHHPDHFFSANPILDAFPGSKLFAAPYVLAGINREYDEKVKFWPTGFGRENIPEVPTKPTVSSTAYSVDHTLFWLPSEKTIICGDAVYARSTHVWVEEIETKAILEAWYNTLDLIEALKPEKVIAGHLESGWELDAKADLAHNRRYLDLFAEKITYAKKKPQVDELFQTFKAAFPDADQNLDFFLGHLSNQFGEGGKVWEENRHHNVGARTKEQLEAYYFRI
ncbi:hypothetical protein LTR95_001947 [Oleoguttula sp. CCFEE 5521]